MTVKALDKIYFTVPAKKIEEMLGLKFEAVQF